MHSCLLTWLIAHSRSQQELRRHNSMDSEFKKNYAYYKPASHSVSDLTASNTVISIIQPTLKRSKTVPNKREKLEYHHDSQQENVHVNNNSNVSSKFLG